MILSSSLKSFRSLVIWFVKQLSINHESLKLLLVAKHVAIKSCSSSCSSTATFASFDLDLHIRSTESGLHFSHFQCYPLMPHTTNHPFHVATCPIQIGPFHRPTLLPVHRSTAPQCRGHKIRMTCSEYQKQLTNLNAAMNGHEHATCPEGWFGIQWARETWRHQRAFATNFRQPLACGSHSENIILGDGLAEGQKIRTNSWEHCTLLPTRLSHDVS